jgi:hypothetical protein
MESVLLFSAYLPKYHLECLKLSQPLYGAKLAILLICEKKRPR